MTEPCSSTNPLLYQMPVRWWRVLKVVVDGIDRAEVRLQGLSTDGARLEEEAQVGDPFARKQARRSSVAPLHHPALA